MQIYGVYNADKRIFYLREGFVLGDFSMPDSAEGFEYKGVAGHFGIAYWDFKTTSEVIL